MNTVANLGMYDGGALTQANDALWSAIERRLSARGIPDAPRDLVRTASLEALWESNALLFGQTCGYPYAARFRDRLRVLGVPEYAVPGCVGGHHRSFVVVHARSRAVTLGALRGRRAAINEPTSMTGRHLLGDAVASQGAVQGYFHEDLVVSGSHAASLRLVATGAVDVAAIDCVSHAHLAEAMPEVVAETRIIHRTRATPSLPFVISNSFGEATALVVARALEDALADQRTAEARRALRLVGVLRPSPALYDETLVVAARADVVFRSAAGDAVTPETRRDVHFGERDPFEERQRQVHAHARRRGPIPV